MPPKSIKKNAIRLSASSVVNWRQCPYKFKGANLLYVQPVETPDTLRIGTNWHAIQEYMHEVYSTERDVNPLDALLAFMDNAYAVCPDYINIEKWEIEKYTLLNAYLAYLNHFGEPQEVVANEIKFELPLRNPVTGRNMWGCLITGRIDKIIKDGNRMLVKEYKTTSKEVSVGSIYWKGLERKMQTKLYVYAIHRLVEQGVLDDATLGEVEYDVFRKPSIKPKTTVKKAVLDISKDSFMYYGLPIMGKVPDTETPEMYGARLLADMNERPEFYFARRSVSVNRRDIEDIEQELFDLYRTIKFVKQNNCFDKNPDACDNPYRCPFISLCNAGIDFDDELPTNFKKGW